ncbi:MAG: DUF3995 domain-containing protein [Mycobacteriales bacterium]
MGHLLSRFRRGGRRRRPAAGRATGCNRQPDPDRSGSAQCASRRDRRRTAVPLTARNGRLARAPAYAAALLAFASAAVTIYWTAGGTALLRTVGGRFEDAATSGGSAVVALGLATAGAKVLAALLALALVQPWGQRLPRRAVTVAAAAAGVVLSLYGGALVVVGALVLAGAIEPAGAVDRTALRWHVGLWDLWFLAWGLLLLLAVWARRTRANSSTRPTRPVRKAQ